MSRFIRLALIALISLSLPASLFAEAIPVVNPSFEDDVLCDGCSQTATVTGWNVTSGGGDGVLNPDATQYPGGVPDGANIAFLNGTGNFVHQTLASNLEAGMRYTLTVNVGQRADENFVGYRVQLRAGGEILAEDNSTQTPTPGTFVTSTVTYKSSAADSELGEPLEIWLLTLGIQSNFDNVQLDAAACCVDPPSGMTAWWPLDENTPPYSAEIINAADGTHVGNPTPIDGKVDLALNFDGVDDYVNAPDRPNQNVGEGDMTIDAWVRTTEVSSIATTILDKRSSGNGVRGYHLFIYNGAPGFQMADRDGSTNCSNSPTVSCTNWLSTASIADGQWHHIAVTVDRDDPAGLLFYVDGQIVDTFDPTIRNLSLDNDGPFRMGVRSFELTGYFEGDIDEVELFKRALSPEEIAALYEADSLGKCKDRITVDTYSPICLGADETWTFVEICNDSALDREYDFLLKPVPAGGNICTVDGPDSFQLNESPFPTLPPATTLTVAGRSCRQLWVIVDRPTDMNANLQNGCFDAIITNTATGESVRDRGMVRDWRECCSVEYYFRSAGLLPDLPANAVDVPLGQTTSITFSVINTSGGPLTFGYRVEAAPPSGMTADSSLSLDGEAPGTALTGNLSFNDGETVDITFTAGFLDAPALTTEDIVLKVDTGGGTFEILMSTRARPALALNVFSDGFESGDTSDWSVTVP